MSENEGSEARDGSTLALVFVVVAGVALFAVMVATMLSPWLVRASTVQPATPTTRPSPTPTPTPTTVRVPAPTPSTRALESPLAVRVLFGQQDVGGDIVARIATAYRNAGLQKPVVKKWADAKRVRGPVFAHAVIGTNGNPRSKLGAFAGLVNEAPRNSIDVAVMTFSYADITAETDIAAVFADYVATMESLEEAHPDVTFLYTTVPLTIENGWSEVDEWKINGLTGSTQPMWQNNIARERFNTLVRQEYGATGRVFDIAAVAARLKGGKAAAREYEGEWYYVLNPALAVNGRRLNATGGTRLATQLLEMIAAVEPKE